MPLFQHHGLGFDPLRSGIAFTLFAMAGFTFQVPHTHTHTHTHTREREREIERTICDTTITCFTCSSGYCFQKGSLLSWNSENISVQHIVLSSVIFSGALHSPSLLDVR